VQEILHVHLSPFHVIFSITMQFMCMHGIRLEACLYECDPNAGLFRRYSDAQVSADIVSLYLELELSDLFLPCLISFRMQPILGKCIRCPSARVSVITGLQLATTICFAPTTVGISLPVPSNTSIKNMNYYILFESTIVFFFID
jgi:hypothetical protein